jgi:ubiquinone/menaquinone biosynthesis C-methylase UbiE
MVVDNNGQEDVASIVTRIKEKLMLTLPVAKDMPRSLSKPEWDYSEQAAYYHARPNYSDRAIDELLASVQPAARKDLRIADIGAGTANLTVMLGERGFRPIAVEPNAAMLGVGMQRTKEMHVSWKLGTGENTGLESDEFDWVMFGSSFNTTDSAASLRETRRILKRGGLLSLMWNHRDVSHDPAQARVEQIIRKHVPAYSPGTRREDPTEVVGREKHFEKTGYIEDSFVVHPTIEQYLDGWRSVKNKYWDVRTPEGREILESILRDIVDALGDDRMEITYTTRIWTWKVCK